MTLNEAVNLATLVALAVLIGIEIGKKRVPQRRFYPTYKELANMLADMDSLFKTPHGEKEPDPFADERPTSNGAVTEVKRPVGLDEDAMEKWAAEETDLDPGRVDGIVVRTGAGEEMTIPQPASMFKEPQPIKPTAIGPDDMDMMERADALRVHIGHHVSCMKTAEGSYCKCIDCDAPTVFFSADEVVVLGSAGDEVATSWFQQEVLDV